MSREGRKEVRRGREAVRKERDGVSEGRKERKVERQKERQYGEGPGKCSLHRMKTQHHKLQCLQTATVYSNTDLIGQLHFLGFNLVPNSSHTTAFQDAATASWLPGLGQDHLVPEFPAFIRSRSHLRTNH